jgi:hypothetical protein
MKKLKKLAAVASEEAKAAEQQTDSATAETKADTSKLNAAEKLELETHEAAISKGNKSFFELGDALNAINKSRLYREYGPFEDYLSDKLLMGRASAYRHMFAAEVMGVISPEGGTLPQNEFQLRPFKVLNVKPDEWKATWKYVVKKAKKKPLTALLITTLICIKRGAKPTVPKKKTKQDAEYVPLRDRLQPVLTLVADARKQLDTGETTGMKTLLKKIEEKLKALNLA